MMKMRRSWRVAAVTATAFVGAMTLSATPAPAQMADMCALVAHNLCVNEPYAYPDYDACYRAMYNEYCPSGGEPNCLVDPATGRTICV